MSDQAITEVTRAIRALLVSQLPSTRQVTLLPPGEDPPASGTGVNLYMYRVEESPFMLNEPYRGDRSGASPRTRPALSLELFYLLTPFGPKPRPQDADDESHKALGEAMLVLHENPVLNRIHENGFDADDLPDELRNSYEEIKIDLVNTNVDELSKIWGTIQKPYRISVVYQVSLVQLVPTIQALEAGAPVQRTSVDVVTMDAPRLQDLAPAAGALARLAAGQVTPSNLSIHGFGLALRGQEPRVFVGGVSAAIVGSATSTDITIVLPQQLDAGPDADVRVRLRGRLSRPLTFTVVPWLSSISPLRTSLEAATEQLTARGAGFVNAAAVRLEGNASWEGVPLAGSTSQETAVTLPAGRDANATPAGTALANGLYEARVRLPDNSLSNARILEVIPRLNPPAGPNNSTYDATLHRLTLRGARLDGTDVRMTFDRGEYVLGANANGTVVQHDFPRDPPAGSHRIAVVVDGHRSHEIAVVIP